MEFKSITPRGGGTKPDYYYFDNNGRNFLFTVSDSHIETLNSAIITDTPSYVKRFYPRTNDGRLFILGVDRANDISKPNRTLDNPTKEIIDEILQYESQIVIMGGRLPFLLENSRFDNKEGGVEPGNNSPGLVVKDGDTHRKATINEVGDAYQKTVDILLSSGCRVVLIYPIPEVGWDVPNTIINMTSGKSKSQIQSIFNDRSSISTSYEVFEERTKSSYLVLDSIKDHRNLLRIYPEDIFCDGERCYTYNKSVYYRGNPP